jgi:hypothetical protein
MKNVLIISSTPRKGGNSDILCDEFAKGAKDADYLHLQAPADEVDAVFADCADDLKAFLQRGGGILFDRYAAIGKSAAKFLADAGVDNPYVKAVRRKKEWDGGMAWNEALTTNHPFVVTMSENDRKVLMRGASGHDIAFGAWNREKQVPVFLVKRDRSFATVIIQDKVLGKGKVFFNTLDRSFNDWYEYTQYGNAVLSWLIGMPADVHRKKAEAYTGGPGEEAN